MKPGEQDRLAEARDLLLSGDIQRLEARLLGDPELVRTRWAGSKPPYDGYFHGATLLHHVAGNPLIRALPASMVETCGLLLDAEAEVDAGTRAGPSQPDDIGWTTLGLVASSAHAREQGIQGRLLNLLLQYGADPDARDGGCLMGALYYGESSAAERLAAAGARLDVVAAAGVGEVEKLEGFLALDRVALVATPRLHHLSRTPWPRGLDASDEADHLLGMSMVYGALHGRTEAIRSLLDAGADPDHVPPFDHGATALHWAVMGDQPEVVALLLEAGADPAARDREQGSTPLEWAEHLGRPRAAAALD